MSFFFKDILAAGYGKFEFNNETNGLICCWCLKNPEFPERFYKTESGVTAVAFSQLHANLLAVGLFNGNILIFDVRNNNTTPLLSTKYIKFFKIMLVSFFVFFHFSVMLNYDK